MTKTAAFDYAKHAELEALVAEANEVCQLRKATKNQRYVASFEYCAARYVDGRLWNTDITIEMLEQIIRVERRCIELGI